MIADCESSFGCDQKAPSCRVCWSYVRTARTAASVAIGTTDAESPTDAVSRRTDADSTAEADLPGDANSSISTALTGCPGGQPWARNVGYWLVRPSQAQLITWAGQTRIGCRSRFDGDVGPISGCGGGLGLTCKKEHKARGHRLDSRCTTVSALPCLPPQGAAAPHTPPIFAPHSS